MPAVTNLHIHLNSINLLYDFVKRLDNSVTLCIILVSITYHIPEVTWKKLQQFSRNIEKKKC